jgi:acetyl-CoA carboxylase carboxyl transferase subunit alpha
MTTWLDFEKPVIELEQKIQELREQAAEKGLDARAELGDLERKAAELRAEVYSNLSAYQHVQLARHPRRPYTLDYLQRCFTNWIELHGDRHFGDDLAIVGGPADLDGRPVMVIGQQKGRDTKENLLRRFGMPSPEGYRKALRLMQLADRDPRGHARRLSRLGGRGAGTGRGDRGQPARDGEARGADPHRRHR